MALDKSCQIDLFKDGGHAYFIKFLDSADAYPEQRAMTAFVLAVIMDEHPQGQEACIGSGLIHLCLKYLRSSSPKTEPLFLLWLCLCLDKLWEDNTQAQIISLQEDSHLVCSSLLPESLPEVRASAVFALGTLLDTGSDKSKVGDEYCDEFDNDEKVRAEVAVAKSLLNAVSDGSPLVIIEVVVGMCQNKRCERARM